MWPDNRGLKPSSARREAVSGLSLSSGAASAMDRRSRIATGGRPIAGSCRRPSRLAGGAGGRSSAVSCPARCGALQHNCSGKYAARHQSKMGWPLESPSLITLWVEETVGYNCSGPLRSLLRPRDCGAPTLRLHQPRWLFCAIWCISQAELGRSTTCWRIRILWPVQAGSIPN